MRLLACVAFAALLRLSCGSAVAQTVPPTGHDHMFFWSTEDDGGALTLQYDFRKKIRVANNICFPASGLCFFNSLDPAFFAYDIDHAEDGLFAIKPDTRLSFELVAADAALSVKVNDKVLDTPPQSAVIATVMVGLHNHPSWQLTVPETERGRYDFSFRVTSESPEYEPSQVYTATITNVPRGDVNCDDRPSAADLVAVARARDPGVDYSPCDPDLDENGTVDACDLHAGIEYLFGAEHTAGCPREPITLPFAAEVNGVPFACGQTYGGVGTSAAEITPSDFRFYIHDVRLVTAGGDEVPVQQDPDGIWQSGNVTLLDFENHVRPCNLGTPQTNTSIRGTAPPYDYRGIRFRLGVPEALNHADPANASSPLNLSALFWSWQTGYKFLRIDTALDNYRIHLGSIGCTTSSDRVFSCARPNVGEADLASPGGLGGVIVADLGALLSDVDLNQNQPETPPGCMSDPFDQDCDVLLRNLGINFADGQPLPGTQKFFSLRPAEP